MTFFSCIRVLLWRDGKRKEWSAINKTMVVAALLMLVFASLDVAFGLRHNLDAFVYEFAKGQHPKVEFAKISKWLNVMKFVNYSAQTFIGDGILVSCPCSFFCLFFEFGRFCGRRREESKTQDRFLCPGLTMDTDSYLTCSSTDVL